MIQKTVLSAITACFRHFCNHHMKILLLDSNTKFNVFQQTTRNESASGYVMIMGLEK